MKVMKINKGNDQRIHSAWKVSKIDKLAYSTFGRMRNVNQHDRSASGIYIYKPGINTAGRINVI